MKIKKVLIISLIISGCLSVFASSFPDGLEKVAEDKIFFKSAVSYWPGFIPDYIMPGVSHEWLATALAGVIGTLLVFGLLSLFGFIIKKNKYESE